MTDADLYSLPMSDQEREQLRRFCDYVWTQHTPSEEQMQRLSDLVIMCGQSRGSLEHEINSVSVLLDEGWTIDSVLDRLERDRRRSISPIRLPAGQLDRVCTLADDLELLTTADEHTIYRVVSRVVEVGHENGTLDRMIGFVRDLIVGGATVDSVLEWLEQDRPAMDETEPNAIETVIYGRLLGMPGITREIADSLITEIAITVPYSDLSFRTLAEHMIGLLRAGHSPDAVRYWLGMQAGLRTPEEYSTYVREHVQAVADQITEAAESNSILRGIAESVGLMPSHPHCRCVLTPVIVRRRFWDRVTDWITAILAWLLRVFDGLPKHTPAKPLPPFDPETQREAPERPRFFGGWQRVNDDPPAEDESAPMNRDQYRGLASRAPSQAGGMFEPGRQYVVSRGRRSEIARIVRDAESAGLITQEQAQQQLSMGRIVTTNDQEPSPNRLEVTITAHDNASETLREFAESIRNVAPCPDCGGRGQTAPQGNDCETCQGRGYVPRDGAG